MFTILHHVKQNELKRAANNLNNYVIMNNIDVGRKL